MISVNSAIQILNEHLSQLPSVRLTLLEARNHYLSESIYAPIDIPSFDNSAMDGYALNLDPKQDEYTVQCVIQAGDQNIYDIKPTHAARIFTGAAVPKNTNCIIAQEQIENLGNSIKINTSLHKPNDHIRKKGSQCHSGDLIAEKFSLVSPSIIGLLASMGIQHVNVFLKPSVGIIVTGNELLPLGAPIEFGKVYNSNEYSLLAHLESIGIHQTAVYHSLDDLNSVTETIQTSLAINDVTILTGGISVGDFDFVLQAMKNNDLDILFHKVKQKPGKPIGVGKTQNKWVFALPGNPAAVITCFNQYVKPSIFRLSGKQDAFSPIGFLPVLNTFTKKSGLTHFLKAHYTVNGITLLGSQESFNLLSFNQANCIVPIPENETAIEIGAHLPIFPLHE